eukprot:10871777-Alexandrium_andersonii.AAC.1
MANHGPCGARKVAHAASATSTARMPDVHGGDFEQRTHGLSAGIASRSGAAQRSNDPLVKTFKRHHDTVIAPPRKCPE